MATRGNAALRPEDVRRLFWAAFLGSKVKNDGQVPGFSRWIDQASRFAAQLAESRCNRCVSLVMRGADPDSCIENSATDLKAELQMFVSPQESAKPTTDEVRGVVHGLASSMGWGDPVPRSFTDRIVADETVFEPQHEESADAGA